MQFNSSVMLDWKFVKKDHISCLISLNKYLVFTNDDRSFCCCLKKEHEHYITERFHIQGAIVNLQSIVIYVL